MALEFIDSSLTGKEVRHMGYPPSFTEGDAANMQTAELDMNLVNPVMLTYGIYGQGRFSWWRQRRSIVNAGFVGYDKQSFPSDGKILYTEVHFDWLKGDGDQIGFHIALPTGDGNNSAGFGW